MNPSTPNPRTSPLPTGEGQGEASNKPLSGQDVHGALRKQATVAEKKPWSVLRDRRFSGYKLRRQHSIEPYVVDYRCHDARLVVAEGAIHGDPARNAADTERQLDLEAHGPRVVRVTNADILRQPKAALAMIEHAMSAPHPVPLPGGEGTT